jgi:hypothetical protein
MLNSLNSQIQEELEKVKNDPNKQPGEAIAPNSERNSMQDFSKLCEQMSPPGSTKNTDKKTPKSQKPPHEISTMGQLLPFSNMADLYKGTAGISFGKDKRGFSKEL